MKKIAVITTFVDIWQAFSLCGIVASHLEQFLKHGYDTTFTACEGFQPKGFFQNPRLKLLMVPNFQLENDSYAVESPVEFRAGKEAIKVKLRPLIAEIDIAITHDIIYLQQHLAYNQACRDLALEFPQVLWLHWIHSAPEPHKVYPANDPRSARFKPFFNGILVYPNDYDVTRVAQQYGIREDDVVVVPHGMDYENIFGFHKLTRALLEKYDLFRPDIFAIYPIRMDRGKQPEKLVRLFSEIKKTGKTVLLMIVNFHSTGRHFIQYREEIIKEAKTLGLTEDEIIFTNRIESLPGISQHELKTYRVEFPQKVVIDLFHLTNIYIHPSASETYSLVCQEAAACGNLLFLNDDFPPMRDIYGGAAHYIKFSSTLFTSTHSPSENAYYREIARKIIYHLQSEKSILQKTRIRQTRNFRAVFRNYIEPLLFANDVVNLKRVAAA
ncbi:MAG: hypothetical protein JSV88_30280 [Candidatus Aminicenantes bacterium]|nr:MAG: hypothetical protein JSV88_30280 [Candidatus Aminicenantes bacterium]